MRSIQYLFFWRRIILMMIILLKLDYAQSQNLVNNPSFEEGLDRCEPNFEAREFIYLATNWSCPTSGTSDIFSTEISNKACYSSMPYAGTDRSYYEVHTGTQKPRTGKRFAGIYTYGLRSDTSVYREYLQVNLKEPLIPGEYYCIKAHVSRAGFVRFATNNLGIYIGDYVTFKGGYIAELKLEPQIVQKQIITETKDWVEISGTIKATQPFQALIIGNFSDDHNTQVLDVGGGITNSATYNSAYYFIDDVSVQKVLHSNTLTFKGDKKTCFNLFTNLTVIGEFDKVDWYLFDDTSKIVFTGQHLMIKQELKTKYFVKALVCGIVVNDTISIGTYSIPKVELGRDTVLCENANLKLNAGTDGKYYEWQDASTNQYLMINKAGNYSVQVTNQFNCTNQDDIKITIRKPPLANIGRDTLICSTFSMLGASNGNSYLWSNGATDSTFYPTSSGEYWVRITNQCGISIDTVHLYSMTDLFIPNVITLNNDTLNKHFKFKGIGEKYRASITIIDRWGNDIYFNNDYRDHWPIPTQEPDAGTYYYLLHFAGCKTYKGWLQVLK